jgi:predicted nucleic acid-binding protein
MRIYLDACVIIYLIEAHPQFGQLVARRIAALRTPQSVIVSSRLSKLECLTLPHREANSRLIALYEAFFQARDFEWVDVSEDVVEAALRLRATYNLKTPDSLHLASSLTTNADIFLTGDVALARCRPVQVEVITAAQP